MLAAIGFALPFPAGAACGATGPVMLGLHLSGRELGDTVHGQVARMAGRRDAAQAGVEPLAELDAALAALNTHVWGLYWVTLYSRRLHEVLDQLDSKPPGPVTLYYDRWDKSQLTNSAALTLRNAAIVREALARTSALAPEPSAKLRKYLEDIVRDLRGCSTDEMP